MSRASGQGGGRVAHRLRLACGLLTLLIALCGAGALAGALVLDSRLDRISDRVHTAEDDNLRTDDLQEREVADEGELAMQQRQIEAYLRVADDQAHTTPGSARAVTLTREATRRFDAFEVTNARLSDRLDEEEQRLEGNADTVIRAGIAGLGAALVAALAVAVHTLVHAMRAPAGPLRFRLNSAATGGGFGGVRWTRKGAR